MTKLQELSKVCRKAIDFIGGTLSCNTIIRTPLVNNEKSHFDNIYYVMSNMGTICNDSVLSFGTNLWITRDKSIACGLNIFTRYCGKLKETIENDLNKNCISWYETYDCEDGEIWYVEEINDIYDLYTLLVDKYSDYFYDERIDSNIDCWLIHNDIFDYESLFKCRKRRANQQ